MQSNISGSNNTAIGFEALVDNTNGSHNIAVGDGAERGFYDPVTASWTIKVPMGKFYLTTRSDEVIVTILGSCVSACIRDVETGIGGMNHFMLASDAAGQWGGDHGGVKHVPARPYTKSSLNQRLPEDS